MKLCMFHPADRPMERGWVGRIDGDRVVHLAAQTLQAFFLGGGGAREHAEYRLDDVEVLVPVLHPPNVRLFDDQHGFSFGNTTAVVGPGRQIPAVDSHHSVYARLAAVIGAEGAIGGCSAFVEVRAPALRTAKANDFGLCLGPYVVTDVDPSEAAMELTWGTLVCTGEADGFDWDAARSLAARNTVLRVGDLLAGPAVCVLDGVTEGEIALRLDGIGTLTCTIARAA